MNRRNADTSDSENRLRSVAATDAAIAFALLIPTIALLFCCRFRSEAVGPIEILVAVIAVGFGLSLAAVRHGTGAARVLGLGMLLIYAALIVLVLSIAINRVLYIRAAGVPLYYDPYPPGGR